MAQATVQLVFERQGADLVLKSVKDLTELDKAAEKAKKSLKEMASGEAQAAFDGLGDKAGKLGELLGALGPAGAVAAAGIGAIVAGFGAAGVVTATLVSWTKNMVATSGTLTDLASQVDVSTTALQEYAFAGAQVGVSQQAIANSVQQASRRIAEGGAQTSSALNQLGLSWASMRNMKPEEQFRAIAEALKGVSNSGVQAALSKDLFGRNPEILRLIRSDFQGAAEDAHRLGAVMSETAVAAGDDLGDSLSALDATWEGLKNTIAAQIVQTPGLTAGFKELAETLALATVAIGESKDGLNSIYEAITGHSLEESVKQLRDFVSLWQVLHEMGGGKPVELSLPSVKNAPKVEVGSMDPASLAITQQAVKLTEELAAADKKAAEEAKKHAEEIKKLAESLGGGGAEQKAKDLAEALRLPGVAAAVSGNESKVRELGATIDKLVKDGLQTIPPELQKIQSAAHALTIKDILDKATESTKKLAEGIAKTNKELLGKEAEGGLVRIKSALDDEKTAAENAARAIEEGNEALKRGEWERAAARMAKYAAVANTLRGLGSIFGGKAGGAMSAAADAADLYGSGQAGGKASLAIGVAGAASALMGPDSKVGAGLGGAASGAKLGAQSGTGVAGMAIGAVIGFAVGYLKKKKELMIRAAREASVDIDKALQDMLSGKGVKKEDVLKFLPTMMKDKKTSLEMFQKLGQDFTALQDQYKAAVLERTKSGVQGLAAMINYVGQGAGNTKDALDRMGTYAMGLFGSLRKQGMGFVEAIREMQPALNALTQKAAETGSHIGGGTAELVNFSNILQANSDLVAATEGAANVISGLRVSGSLTAETFQNLETEVTGYLQALEGTGLTATQALAVAAPSLYQLKKAHEDMGLVLDAETQKQIEAADAAGLFQGLEDPIDNMVKAMNVMVEIMSTIAQKFGATLPDSVYAYINSLNQIPTNIETQVNINTTGSIPTTGVPTSPANFTGPSFAEGGFGDFGSGTMAMLHGKEYVVPAADMQQIMSPSGGGGWGGGGDSTQIHYNPQVTVNGSGLNTEQLAVAIDTALKNNEKGLATRVRRVASGRE